MTPLQTSAFNNQIPPRQVIRNITSNYTVTGADYGVVLNVVSSASVTLTFAPSASLGAGFQVTIWNNISSAAIYAVTLQPNDNEKIDGFSSINLNNSEGTQIISDGTNLNTGYKKTMRFYAESAITPSGRASATNNGALALGGYSSASGVYSTALGTNSNAHSGYALALGPSYANGYCSVAIQTQNCSSYGTGGFYSTAMGYHAKSATCYGQAYGYGTNAAGTSAVAIGKCATATGTSTLSFGTSTTATPNYSTAIGNNGGGTGSVTATSVGAMALGGSYASGACSFAAAIGNNTSSYGALNNNAIAIGYHAKVSCCGTNGIAIGSCSSSKTLSATAIGVGASASFYGTAIGFNAKANCGNSLALGRGATANDFYATAIGYYTQSNTRGKYAYTGTYITSAGDSQTGTYVAVASTTNATPTVLVTQSGATASSDTQINLPNNTAYAFTGIVVARQQAAGGTASAAWSVSGLIRREATAGTTTLVASTVTAISNVPAWTLALSADTTNGALAVTFTGAASTNIHCVATIQTSEVTYA